MHHLKTFALILLLLLSSRVWAQDSLIFDATFDKAWGYKNQDKQDSALYLVQALLPAVKQAQDQKREGNCYNLLGIIYRKKQEYPASYACFKQALDIRRALGDQKGIASVYNNVAAAKIDEKRFVEASDTVGQAILIYRALGDSLNLAKAFLTLSNVYQEYRDFETAAIWLRQSIDVYHQKQDTSSWADAIFNFGNLYYNLEKFDSASVQFKLALTLYEAQGDLQNQGLTHNMLAAIYMDQGDAQAAWQSYLTAERFLKEAKSEPGLFKVCFGKGLYLQNQNQHKKALEQFNLALQNGNGTPQMRIDLLMAISGTYRFLNQPDSADHYEKLANASYKSLFNTAGDAETINQHLQKWQEKKAMQEDLASWTQTGKRLLGFVLVLSILLITLAFSFYYRQKLHRQERNQQLQVIKELTNNLELNYINARFEGQQAEKKALGRELHDRIGAMMATLKWRYEAIGEKLSANTDLQQLIRDANLTFGAIYQDLRNISHQLESDGSGEKVELVTALQKLCADISQSGKINASFFVHGLEGRLDYKTEINLLHILQEIVANALKHSEAKNLTIQLTKLGQQLTLMVEDDGKGFDPYLHRAGAGMRHMEERVAALGGTLQIDSIKKGGVTTIIEIPLLSSLHDLTIPASGHDKTNQGLFGG